MTWTPNPWRDLGTAILFNERECRQWDLTDIDKHPEGWAFAPESRAFLVFTIDEINREINRRKRLRLERGAPGFPNEQRDLAAELEEIKRRVSLIDLIHSEVWREYERRGPHDVWCLCPLPGHSEKTPSFHIDEERQVFKCFGCDRGGDLFELAGHLYGEPLFARRVARLRVLAGIRHDETATDGRRGPAPMRRRRR